MKIKISLLFVLFLGYAWVAAEPIVVGNYSFELPADGKHSMWDAGTNAKGTFTDVPNWTSDTPAADSGVEQVTDAADGVYRGFIMSNDPSTWNLTDHVIAAGAVYTLQVNARDTWTPTGMTKDFKISLFYDNAGTRVTAATATFDLATQGTPVAGGWKNYTMTFAADDLAASIGHQIGVELDNVASGTGSSWHGMDNVRLDVDYVNAVTPADGTQGVGIDTNLEWAVADNWDVDVYLSGPYVDPNSSPVLSKVVSDQAVTSYNPPADLANERWYYWRVDAREPNVPVDIIHEGSVWAFKTVQAEASISAVNPAYTAVAEGETATLSVTGAAVTSWQWYKIGSPDEQLTEGTKYSGVTTNTLTISNVQPADEGYYYCVGSNLIGSASNRDTGPGRVMTQRLTSYYPFETTTVVDGNDVTPDIVGGFDAILKQESVSAGWPTLNDANALVGTYCLQFDNADHATDPNGQYAQIPAGVADYENISITVWVHSLGGSEWQRIYDFGNGVTNYMFLSPDVAGGGCRFAITNTSYNSEQQLNASWLPNGSWYFVAVTISGNTGRLYVNGELVNTNTGMNLNPNALGLVLNYLGESQFPADPEFNGMLDDLKIYNYARTSEEIAKDYIAVRGGWVCNNEGTADLTYDLNDDCRVDLGDFAMMAAKWLNNNRIYQQ